MLAVFSGEVVEVPAELVAAGSRTPSPKTKASELVNRFLGSAEPAVSVQLGSLGHLAYSHASQALLRPRGAEATGSPTAVHRRQGHAAAQDTPPRSPHLFPDRRCPCADSTERTRDDHLLLLYIRRSFAAKDEIFCLFEGVLDNLGRLSQQYGLSKGVNEVVLVIEAYKTLRDRAPYPASFMLSQLTGSYAFVLFDKSTSSLLVASDPEGKVPLFWGITADGCVSFSDNIDLLKGSCVSESPEVQVQSQEPGGSSFELAEIIRIDGCFYSNALGGLKCYENPKNKVTAVPANEEEICGATFEVEGSTILTALH